MSAEAAQVIQSVIYDILARVCGVSTRSLSAHDELAEVVEMTSMTIVQLAIELHSQFAIDFGLEPSDLDALKSVASLAELVERRLAVVA
ncbi:MAG: hypothetical protein RLZZ450_7213 [Pseudomonadota bacterium]|jgi:acyl carrier protein